MKASAVVLLALALALVGTAAELPNRTQEEGLSPELAKVPHAARGWENPYLGQAEAVQAGKKLFLRHCAECHGTDGRGRNKAPNLHSPQIQRASQGTLFWFLRNGNLKQGMPSWSRLPDARVWQIVTYLKTLCQDN